MQRGNCHCYTESSLFSNPQGVYKPPADGRALGCGPGGTLPSGHAGRYSSCHWGPGVQVRRRDRAGARPGLRQPGFKLEQSELHRRPRLSEAQSQPRRRGLDSLRLGSTLSESLSLTHTYRITYTRLKKILCSRENIPESDHRLGWGFDEQGSGIALD